MINTNEIHKVMSEEFMGHKVDGVIIAPPLELTPEIKLVSELWREYATRRLNEEAKFFWDQS